MTRFGKAPTRNTVSKARRRAVQQRLENAKREQAQQMRHLPTNRGK